MPDSPSDQSSAPLFSLDLGGNGGIVEPHSAEELLHWINAEINFWEWFPQTASGIAGGITNNRLQQPLERLTEARNTVTQALQYRPTSHSELASRLSPAQGLLRAAYISFALPHSTSTLGKRIKETSKTSPGQAIGYAFTKVSGSAANFDSQNMDVFAGFLEGLFEQYNFPDLVTPQVKAASASIDDLRGKIEHLFSKAKDESENFKKEFVSLAENIGSQKASQQKDYEERTSSYQNDFGAALTEHRSKMESIETTFKEGMRLRGPVGYWERRLKRHTILAIFFGILSFVGIGSLGIGIWNLSRELFGTLKVGQNPSSWQITSLVLVAVFGAWAVRILVRLFLSNSHLATDADERVVMTQTYLALLEESKLTEEKDRSLVLAALFRPSSDGMVKEENIPNPTLDLLTKLGSK